MENLEVRATKVDFGQRRKTLTAVLFTGGLSRRMGADKATLPIAGEPLWARQVRLLRGFQPDVLWISARARPAWCPSEIEVITDESPSRGPLSGLSAALQKLSTSHLLAVAIDLPQMTAEPLSNLWSLAQPGCGVIPAHNDFLEPLCAIYPAEATTNAAAALSRGEDVSMQSFARALLHENRMKIYPLSESERRLFHNVNTPQDLEHLSRP